MLRTILSASLLASSVSGASWIVPGAVWYDTSGKVIDAHGGGIYRSGDTFYWIGHSAPDTSNVSPKLYSSTDLLNWQFVGSPATSAQQLWRPKLIKPNGEFWIYGQQDRSVLSLRSGALTGQYSQYKKVRLPPNSYSYSDTGMFFDEASGTYYILTSADHNTIQINKIEADGSVGAMASRVAAGALEAPGIFKEGGVYFLIVSGKTGYRPNPNKVYTATSLAGPWTGGSDIAPPEQKTYNSQNTFELTIKGSQATRHIYMGDNWEIKGGAASTYVWLPINVNVGAKTAKLEYHSMWKIDAKTGVVSFPTTKKRYTADAPGVKLSKRSGVNEVSFRGVAGTGALQWIRLNYHVNNPEAGDAHIIVNDGPAVNVSSMNSRAGYHHSIPVQVKLNADENNTIRLGMMGQDLEVGIDGIEIFEEDFEL